MAAERRSKRNLYKPGTVVEWDDKCNWLCHCTSGKPRTDAEMSGVNATVKCCGCKNWEHVKCYGLQELHDDPEFDFDTYSHCCKVCDNTKPTSTPIILKVPRPLSVNMSQATVVRNDGDKGKKKKNDKSEMSDPDESDHDNDDNHNDNGAEVGNDDDGQGWADDEGGAAEMTHSTKPTDPPISDEKTT